MKKIISLFLVFSLSSQAAPPTGIGSQSSTIINYSNNTIAPYNQATKLPGVNTLIETGSENMFANPSFEASTLSGWTCTTGTCTKTTTSGEFSSGLAAMKVAISAQAMNVSQTVNTPSGIQKQGYVRVLYRVPATMADFQICSIVNSAEQTCVPTNNLVKDDTFRSIEIPLTFNATNAGIKFKTTSSYTANAYFDAAIVAQGLGTQNLMLDNVYSAKISSAGVVSGENTNFITGNCTTSATSTQTCLVPNGIFTVVPNCGAFTQEDGRYNADFIAASSTATSLVFRTTDSNTQVAGARPISIYCQKSGNDYLASSANVYSQSSANYDWTSYISTLTGFTGVTTATCKHRRVGGDLEGKCSWITGTTGASLFSMTLPSGLSLDTARMTTLNTTAAAGQQWGTMTSNASNLAAAIISAPNTSTTLLYVGSVYINPTILIPGFSNGSFSSGVLANIDFKIPISGWSNSSVIVGSFAGIEKCENNGECDDTYSAYITSPTTITTTSKTGWISSIVNGSTGDYTVNFGAGYFTVAPVCTCTTLGGSSRTCSTYSPTTTSINVQTLNVSLQNNNFHIICQKQGVDYKPKTAKVASSIGVPTVPGITTEAIDTFSVSYGTTNATTACTASPCSYLDQIGNAVSSITRSGVGAYSLNTVKTYSKLKCVSGVSDPTGAARFIGNVNCSNCAGTTFASSNISTIAADSFGTLNCVGAY